MKKEKKFPERIWQAGLLSALLLVLCGCTRKEELLLVTGEPAEMSEELSALPENTGRKAGGAVEGTDRQTADGDGGTQESSLTADSPAADAAAAQSGVIYVHVCGAVVHPGVYELEAGSRVYEAVGRAGGFSESADQNYVNQAQKLEDGVMLVIPTRDEAADARERETASAAENAQGGGPEKIGIVRDETVEGLGIVGGAPQEGQEKDASAVSGGKININTASEAQLCEIPGVGVTRAAAIAAYREAHGAFEKPEDIMKVNGIKEGMYEKIKDSISVK